MIFEAKFWRFHTHCIYMLFTFKHVKMYNCVFYLVTVPTKISKSSLTICILINY